MVVSIEEVASLVVGTAVVSAVLLAATLPWAREPAKLLPPLGAGLAGIVLWNVLLNLTHAAVLNVDGTLGLSAQDLGSGIVAMASVAVVGTMRRGRGREVAVAVCVIGLVTVLIDRFV